MGAAEGPVSHNLTKKASERDEETGVGGESVLERGPKARGAGGRRLHVIFPFIPVSRAKQEKSTSSPFTPPPLIFHLGNLVILSSVGLIC